MQFSSYADFRAKFQSMFDGDDGNPSDVSGDVLDLCIAAGEVQLYRILRSSTMDSALSVLVAGNVGPLPDDFLELRGAPYVPTFRTSVFAPWEQVQDMIQMGCRQAAHPCYYSFEGDNLIFYPSQDQVTVTGRYYAQFAPISTGLNALFNRHWDCFLYAALANSAPFIGEMQRLPIWKDTYDTLVESANEQERRRITRGSKLQTRVG